MILRRTMTKNDDDTVLIRYLLPAKSLEPEAYKGDSKS